MQMEISEAGKIIELIFIYHTITGNWFIDYCDRPTYCDVTHWFVD